MSEKRWATRTGYNRRAAGEKTLKNFRFGQKKRIFLNLTSQLKLDGVHQEKLT